MPSRILSQKINVSNSLSHLSAIEEVVFLHLIVSVDDYGRFYGHPDIVKGMLFSRREFTVKQVESALQKLEAEGMIRRYECDGTTYLELTAWMKYQKPRAKESKYPGPADEGSEMYEPEDADTCEQPQEEEANQEDTSPVLFEIPLNKGMFGVTQAQLEKYRSLYPAVDIEQELRNMIGWCDSYPSKRKTANGVKGFITRWLSKAQNQAKNATAKKQSGYVPNHAVSSGTSDNPFR